MASYTPTILFLSAQELEQICLFVKSASLAQKLSALNNPHGATLMTMGPDPAERLLSMFEGAAKETLSRHIKDPTQTSTFSLIQSIPLDRNQRREIHNLIRQLSKGTLDSGLDHKTSRINVYLRGTGSSYHKPETQRPRFPQKIAPRTAGPRNVAPRNVVPRAGSPLEASSVIAPRAAPSIILKAEQQQKLDAWNKAAAEQTALNLAARAEAIAAPPMTDFKEKDWVANETFKCTAKPQEEESAEVVAERAERKKNAVPPHMRRAAAKKDLMIRFACFFSFFLVSLDTHEYYNQSAFETLLLLSCCGINSYHEFTMQGTSAQPRTSSDSDVFTSSQWTITAKICLVFAWFEFRTACR
ncbi:hypothetical protein D6D28_03235 [Aureobasidium pullulans]|uniref:R3H domain-containing protein n=1 Tax=Aureobasidium pullulans TaxID=5580 RepID=A0A4S8SR50_AURPU|nr:hypothetical protein D6D28_03235 [Aureobasidium pullulans]